MDELQGHLRAAEDSAAEWEQRHRDAEGALAEQRRARGNLERRLEDAETRLERSLRQPTPVPKPLADHFQWCGFPQGC